MARRAVLAGALAALATLPGAGPAGAAGGDLDPSFGTGAKFTQAVGPGNANITAAAVQPDGKIVIAGFAEQSASAPVDRDFLVARLNANGTLDTTGFNAGGAQPGVRTTPISAGTADDAANAVALGPGGTIYVAGATDPAGGDFGDFAVVRYTSTGLVDTGFSTDGIQTHSRSSVDRANGVAVQTSDGKPLLAGLALSSGFQVLRLDPTTGALDTTYNALGITPGVQEVPFGGAGSDEAFAIALEGDDEAVVAGAADSNSSSSDLALARLKTDGTLDTTGFGAGTGKVQAARGDMESAKALALAEGKIVVAGTAQLQASAVKDFIVARYLGDGSPDNSFSTDAVQTTPFVATDGTRSATATGVLVQNGRVLVTGSAFNCAGAGCSDFAAARYLDNGNLDPGFGGTGKRTYGVGAGNDFATAVVPRSSAAMLGFGSDGTRDVLSGRGIFSTGDSPAPGGGTGPGTTAPEPPRKWDLAPTVVAPRRADLAGKIFEATLVVTNTTAAQRASPEGAVVFAARTQSVNGKFTFVSLVGPPLGGPPRVSGGMSDCRIGRISRCTVPPLGIGARATVSFGVPATGEVVEIVASAAEYHTEEQPKSDRPECRIEDEVTCLNNDTRGRTTVPGPRAYFNELDQNSEQFGLFFTGGATSSQAKGGGSRAGGARAAARAPKVKRVQVAILRKRGKVKAAAPLRCLWVRNLRGRFKRIKPGAKRLCDRPVWLRARGTKRWRFKLRRRLPKGRYVVYARAIDAAGHRTSSFSKRRRNRIAFRLR